MSALADELLNAARTGNAEAIKRAVREGVDLEARDDSDGRTALMLAVVHGHDKCCLLYTSPSPRDS